MEVIRVSCHVCERRTERLLRIVNDVPVVACCVCGYIYACPRPTPAALTAWYGSEASNPFYQAEFSPAALEGPAFAFVQRSLERAGVAGRILEVGCGRGDLVHYLRGKGYDAKGTDLCTKDGVDEHLMSMPRAMQAPGGYEPIICRNVLEHVFDPLAFLRDMHRLLVPSGMLYLKVPSARWVVGWRPRRILRQDHALCPPAHLNYLNLETLAIVLGKTGFTVRRRFCEPPSRDPRPLLNLAHAVAGRVFDVGNRLGIGLAEGPTIGVVAHRSDRPSR